MGLGYLYIPLKVVYSHNFAQMFVNEIFLILKKLFGQIDKRIAVC